MPGLSDILKKIEGHHAALHHSAIEIGEQFHQADASLPQFLTEQEVDHLKWASKCKELFLKNLDKLEVTTDDHKCGLGKFLHGPAGKKASASDPQLAQCIEALTKPHAKLHASAIDIQKTWKKPHPGLVNILRMRLDDHRKWAASIADALLAGEKIAVQTDPTKCGFGKWLGGDQCKTLCADWPEFAAIIKTVNAHHATLHASAIKITAAAPTAKATIFKNETSRELEQVATLFSQAIAIEEANVAASKGAQNIFDTKTLPALADTQMALFKVKDRATTMLSGMQTANQTYATKTKPALVHVQSLLKQARELVKDNIMTQDEMLNSAQSTKFSVGLVGAVGIVSGAVLAFFIAIGIVRMLKQVASILSGGAEQTSSASGQVSSASQSLAQGASEQAASVEEVTASIEEMASMTKQNATNASEAKSLAANAAAGANKGTEAMERMSSAIEDIKKSSDETAKIIKTIDEIAFQTNLLALNAAVEAARAGEAGKGFAVVAEEVRNLAQRSAQAAKDTAEMIEGSVTNADNGVAISTEVAALLDEICGHNRKVNDLVGEIAAASNEQAQGIDQINTAVGQMDQVTQSNAANAEESASASEELSAQAEQLNDVVGQLQHMVGGGSTGQTTPGAGFQADNSTVGSPQKNHHAKPSLTVPKRPTATPASVAANQEAFPMDDDTDLGSF